VCVCVRVCVCVCVCVCACVMCHKVVVCSTGTGSNVCYMEELSNVEKVHPKEGTQEARRKGRKVGRNQEEENTEDHANHLKTLFYCLTRMK